MNCITLIGMPGCGKSTVGVVLAKASGKDFIDTDILIQEHEGELLQNIINHNGIEHFKKIEAKALTELSKNNCVIATGGSAIYYPEAIKNLKSLGTIVYIKLSFETIKGRLDNIKTRGIAMEAGQTLEMLYEQRVPLYEKYADVVIDGENKDVEDLVQEILEIDSRSLTC
jgi:shikimate kinase